MSELKSPTPRTVAEHLAALWQRRELIVEFTRRDLKVRYRGTVLGVLWTFLNPLATMLILSVVFSYALRGGVEKYPAFFLCGQIPWLFFASSLAAATRSLTEHAGLIKRSYFPREVFPIACALGGFVHLLISMPLLFGFLLAFGVTPSATWLLLPVVLLVLALLVTGLALLLSACSVALRDLEQLVPIGLNLWFFATPIFYPLVTDEGKPFVPEWLQPYVYLNPMAGLVVATRDLLMRGRLPEAQAVIPSAALAVIFVVVGYLVFLRLERRLAERV